MFTPPLVATVAVALGKLHKIGGVGGIPLSAHEGSNEFCAQANRRFLVAFNGRMIDCLHAFHKQEAFDIMEFYAPQYLQEEEWGRLFLLVGSSPLVDVTK